MQRTPQNAFSWHGRTEFFSSDITHFKWTERYKKALETGLSQ